jgi:iron complex outermembrane receptor protein
MARRYNAIATAVLLAVPQWCVASESLDQVVVTARRQAETASSVPLSLEVITADDLRRDGIDGLQSLASHVPGLYFESGWGGIGSAPTIRGQAQPGQAGDNVGVFVDGVYQANSAGVDTSLLDVERIEVLRGPQSALYGHSTFAGAINYVTRSATDSPDAEVSAFGGLQRYREGRGAVSGPLGTSGLRYRISAGLSDVDGSIAHPSGSDPSVGGSTRRALALVVDAPSLGNWRVIARARYSDLQQAQPAVAGLLGDAYNCGAIGRTSGYWSYYCGDLPVPQVVSPSIGLPDSRSVSFQSSLQVERQWQTLKLSAFSTFYRSVSTGIRDFDATSQGELFGVCTVTVNCPVTSGGPRVLTRFMRVNEVSRDVAGAREWDQEIRLSWTTGPLNAFAGVQGFLRDEKTESDFGAEGTGLSATDRLTALLPATPQQAGPISIVNRFLVSDPARAQVLRSRILRRRYSLSAFAAADLRLAGDLRLHGELRYAVERGHDACGLSGCSGDIGNVDFRTLTPRLSIDHPLGGKGLLWASVAEGARSGGSNDDPTLSPQEQQFGPERNRSYELGVRTDTGADRATLQAVLFYIDWRNTQILGPSNSSGDHGFVTRNLSGITTRGVEASASLRLPADLAFHAAATWVDPRFRAGSEDVGGIGYCGITTTSTQSSFCVTGPSRDSMSTPAPVVPYIDGNSLMRAPRLQWTASLQRDWRSGRLRYDLHYDVAHQDGVLARPIGGARYGDRTLQNVGIELTRGNWSIEARIQNLTDLRYIRMVNSRGQAFYPASPRPLDLTVGDGRRFTLGIRWRPLLAGSGL